MSESTKKLLKRSNSYHGPLKERIFSLAGDIDGLYRHFNARPQDLEDSLEYLDAEDAYKLLRRLTNSQLMEIMGYRKWYYARFALYNALTKLPEEPPQGEPVTKAQLYARLCDLLIDYH